MKASPTPPPGQPTGTGARFDETRWTLVLRGQAGGLQALDELCRTYWYPLYAFVRRSGQAPADAQDITQSFFARLLEKRVLEHAVPGEGRFRSFLLKCLQNFIRNEYAKAQTWKRGGGRLLEWDALEPEQRYALEPAGQSPETLYDSAWAIALTTSVLGQLRADYAAKDKAAVFDALRPYLTTDWPADEDAALAAALAINRNTLKSERLRLRREYAQRLRREIRETLHHPTDQDVRDEVTHLFASLARLPVSP